VLEPFQGKFRSILLLGPPGSGKGTLGKELAATGGQYHLSSGDIFRGLAPDSPAGKLYYSFASKGLLVPDEATVEIWRSYVAGLIATNRYFPSDQFLLLDGIPRTLAQAQLLEDAIEVERIILLEASQEPLIARLQRRATIEGRHDDLDVDVLQKRMEVYQTQTAQLTKHYQEKLISRFNAEQRPLEVLRDVLVELADLLSDHCRSPGD